MITQAGRFEMFRNAVRDFLAQTYEPKELIIVSSSPRERLEQYKHFLQGLHAANIKFVVLPSLPGGRQQTLGCMRNEANRQASGTFCCTWDDDDRYHPDRLHAHYDPIADNRVDLSYMNQQLHFFVALRQLYWVDWLDRRAPGIIMYRRTDRLYPEAGQTARRGEDTSFLRVLVNELGYQVCKANGDATLYLRNFHGNNTWHFEHHIAIARRSVLDHDLTLQRRDDIERAVRYFELLSPVHVHSKSGYEFTL